MLNSKFLLNWNEGKKKEILTLSGTITTGEILGGFGFSEILTPPVGSCSIDTVTAFYDASLGTGSVISAQYVVLSILNPTNDNKLISGSVDLSIEGIGSFNNLYFVNHAHSTWGGYLLFTLPKKVYLSKSYKVGEQLSYDVAAVESVSWPNIASNALLNQYFSSSIDSESTDFLSLSFTNDNVSVGTTPGPLPSLVDNILGFKDKTTYQVHMEITKLFEFSLGGGGKPSVVAHATNLENHEKAAEC